MSKPARPVHPPGAMTSAARPLPFGGKYNARAKKKQLMELVYDFIDEQLNADWTEAVKQYELLRKRPELVPGCTSTHRCLAR